MARNNKAGYILITMAVAMVVLFGALGLAFDLGRAFLVKNELQAYTDAAAIAAALQLNGQPVGFNNASNQIFPTDTAPMSVNRWNFSTQVSPNASTTLNYGTSGSGPFTSAATAPLNSGYAEVTSSVSVPMYILPLVVNSSFMTVNARSVAGQVASDCLTMGCFPFSPMGHSNVGPNWGLQIGQQYTLRWGSGFNGGCAGDLTTDARSGLAYNVLAQQRSGGNSSNRGFVGQTANAATYRAEVVDQLQFGLSYQVGSPVTLNSGDNNTIRDALIALVNQDTDPLSVPVPPSSNPPPVNYDPLNGYTGNGRRIVDVPVSDPDNSNIVLGFEAFLLMPVSYYQGSGGNADWCGIFIGGYNQGSHTTAANGGMYKTRLVQ